MRRSTCITLALLLLLIPSLAKEKIIQFDCQAAWSYIKKLAGETMLGRKSGHPGHELAEQYIAAKFKEWDLEPAGDNGSYFQEFSVEYNYVNQGAALEIWTDKLHRDFYYREDWRVQRYSGSGNFAAEIIFVGYGIHAPEKGYDDYDGVDIKGKLVLLTPDSPKKYQKKLAEEAKIDNRVKAAKKFGARGVIVFKPPSSTSRYFRFRMSKELYDPDFVVLSIENKVLDFIFKELKTDLRYPFQQIQAEGKPVSFPTGVKAVVSINTEYDPQRKTRNILAKISGTDKKLKEEYVIIGGHMDHLGVNPNGDVYNGANDNASGTAVVMEIARIFKLNNYRPKRTIIFAAWAAEEMGLLGSRYFCDNPCMPIEKCVTYYNMDMVAHGDGKVRFNGVYYGAPIWQAVEKSLAPEILEYVKTGRGGPGGSDHSPFLAKGVPAYSINTSGHHFKYHHVRDDSDLVKPDLLKKVGDFVSAATKTMADAPGDFIQPRRQAVYNLKYRDLVNYKTVVLSRFVEHRKDVKEPHVDLQLALVEEQKELAPDLMRVDIINQLMVAAEKITQAKSLQMYSPDVGLYSAVRSGKTSVLTGLKGINALRDDPKWAGVLAQQGVFFLLLDSPGELFQDNTLTEAGAELIKCFNRAGLLLLIKGADEEQASLFLKASKKPLALLMTEVPGPTLLELIKEKEGAVGLLLEPGAEAAAYYKKIEEVKKDIGTRHVMIVNEGCLWKDTGKEQMLSVIEQILQKEYERADFANILTATFLRLINAAGNNSSR